MTRSPTPPRGRVTLHEAASLSGLSYSEVYRRVTADPPLAPAVQAPDGTWTMARKDAEALRRRQPSSDPRSAVMVRAPVERVARWRQAAGQQPVSSWLAELGDAAVDGERLDLLTRQEVRRWRELASEAGMSPMEWLRGKLSG